MATSLGVKPRVRVRAGATAFGSDAAARTALASRAPVLRAHFDATQGRRRLRSWNPASDNLNSLLANGGDALVRRARDLCRNNAYARAACDAFAAAVVGAGIKPSSLLPDAEDKAEVARAWLEWTDEADADSLTDFYGQQALAARALFEAGECFVRFRPRRLRDGFSAPLQVQLLEAEMVPWDLNRTEPSGTVIRCGIEFNPIGQRVAYWFHRRHPGDFADPRVLVDDLYVRVPASEVLHLYQPLRPGQIRGVPWLTPAMVSLKLLDDYEDAELERKRLAAMFAGFITTPAPLDPVLEEAEEEPGGDLIAALEPGLMQKLLPGEDVKFSEPADVGGTYESFLYRQLTRISAALGMPYHGITGDLRQTNYSSIRAGMVEFRRKIEQLQHAVFVFQLCRPVWARWMEAAVLSGRLPFATGFAASPRTYLAVKWITPAWAWVDPLKDRQAEQLAVEQGWKSRSDVIEAEGYDPEEVDARIKADQEREAALGLALGPRGAPPAEPAPDEDEAEPVEEAA